MANEDNQAPVVAAEVLHAIQSKPRFGIVRAIFGIIIGLLSFFSILLFGLMIFTYFSTQVNKESIRLSLFLFGIFAVITVIPGFFLLKPLLKVWKEKTKSEVHESGKYYAGFWRRLGAGFVDFLLFSPIYFVWYFIGKINFAMYELAYWIGIIATIYTLILVTRFGQTIGKMLFKVKVYKVDGAEVTFKESLKRIYGDICLWIILIISHIYTLSRMNLDQLNGMTFYQISQEFAKVKSWSEAGLLLIYLWYFSEFITLLFNRKKRAIHDFIAGTIMLVENRNGSMNNRVPEN